MIPVRLDVVVKVKQREEERRLDGFSKALSLAERAKALLAEAEAVARKDTRRHACAADFSADDAARRRQLEQVAQTRQVVAEAQKKVEVTRGEWVDAKRRADAVGRVADARRRELEEAQAKREQKGFDDLALLQFARAR